MSDGDMFQKLFPGTTVTKEQFDQLAKGIMTINLVQSLLQQIQYYYNKSNSSNFSKKKWIMRRN